MVVVNNNTLKLNFILIRIQNQAELCSCHIVADLVGEQERTQKVCNVNKFVNWP